MGSQESKEILENDESKRLREIAENSGPGAVMKYINEHRNKWKKEPVKFGITGRSATGKSTFINAVRNVRPGHPTFAQPGSGNTTFKPEAYVDPQNSQIVYYDLPGVATLQFPKETYIKEMKLYDYDYFFIFFDKVIGEDDGWMIKVLKELKKPFSLIRSKIDEDINSAKFDGRNEKDVIPEIRRKIETDRRRHNATHPDNMIDQDNIFLISSRDIKIGDMDRLIRHIEVSLPSLKFEAIMYSISFMSKEIIDKKYKMLKKRIFVVTAAAAAIAAIPVPGLDAAINTGIIVEEIIHYKNVFGLREKDMQEIPEDVLNNLKCRNILKPGSELVKFIVAQIGKLMGVLAVSSVADILLPIIGSVIAAPATGVAVYRFLSGFLDDLRSDVTITFDYIMQNK